MHACPTCRTNLAPINEKSQINHFCNSCDYIWITDQDLVTALAKASPTKPNYKYVNHVGKFFAQNIETPASKNCPECKEKLTAFNLFQGKHIPALKCTHGVLIPKETLNTLAILIGMKLPGTNTKPTLSRQCPVDHSKLQHVSAGKFDGFGCFWCGGCWVENETLTKQLKPLVKDVSESALLTIKKSRDPSLEDTLRVIGCLNCKQTMQSHAIGSAPDEIVVERCRQDHGFWFDEGEMEEATEKLQNVAKEIPILLEQIRSSRTKDLIAYKRADFSIQNQKEFLDRVIELLGFASGTELPE